MLLESRTILSFASEECQNFGSRSIILPAITPKGTKTEWNSEPLKILKKLKVLSGNWTYDFKKDRKNIFYDKILKF